MNVNNKRLRWGRRLFPIPDQIVQIEEFGVAITFNPDDSRFYIEVGNAKVASYKDWRNATARWKREVKRLEL